MRRAAAALLALALAAAPAGAADLPPPPVPPAILAAHLIDGAVAIDDFGWIRGRFPGASAAEVALFAAALQFSKACGDWSRIAMRARLAALGQALPAGNDLFVRPAACRGFDPPAVPDGTSWSAFAAAAARVRPYAVGIVAAVGLVERQAGDGDLAAQLRTRPLGEQMLRYASIDSQRRVGETAGYTPLERELHEAMLRRALGDRDEANTRWLAAEVAQRGWPSAAKVGPEAARAAWLLTQHADADPAFQLTALRLMAPLVETGLVAPRDHAMLTDRVTLRLSGRQRYGTQWQCAAGRRVPLPLEGDATATERLRGGAGLDTLAQNAVRLDAMYGACPPPG